MDRPSPVDHAVEGLGHRLAGQRHQVVPDEGEELDQVAVGVDDRVIEAAADVGHLVARRELESHGPLLGTGPEI